METKINILLGAQELFFKYGIKSITMEDIAKHLAISKKTIYKHYKDKTDIVETMMRKLMDENEKEFDKIRIESNNIVEEVFGMMKNLSELFSKMNPNIFYDIQKQYPKIWLLFNDFKEECIERMVIESISKGKIQGFVRPEVDANIIAKMRMCEVEMGFNPDIFPPTKFKIIDVQLALLDHFLCGICTLKGHKLIDKLKQKTK